MTGTSCACQPRSTLTLSGRGEQATAAEAARAVSRRQRVIGRLGDASVALSKEVPAALVRRPALVPVLAGLPVPGRAALAVWARRPVVRWVLGAALLCALAALSGRRLRSAATGLAGLPAPDLRWLSVVGVSACGFYLCCAVSVRAASGQPLAFTRTVAAQLASAAANRLLPAGVGATAVNVRYLHQAGLRLPAATVAVAAVGFTVTTLHLAGAALAVGLAGGLLLHPPALPLAAVAGICAAAAVLVLSGLVCRGALAVRLRTTLGNGRLQLSGLLHSPRRIAVLLATALGSKASHLLGLAAALHAYGVHLPLLTVAGAYLTASLVAAVVPAPAGLGPLEAALLAAFANAGAAAAPALAAVISFRLLGYWLPVLPGVLALRRGRRAGWL